LFFAANIENQADEFQVKKETFQGDNSGCFDLIISSYRTGTSIRAAEFRSKHPDFHAQGD
jgi:hypothetical protein